MLLTQKGLMQLVWTHCYRRAEGPWGPQFFSVGFGLEAKRAIRIPSVKTFFKQSPTGHSQVFPGRQCRHWSMRDKAGWCSQGLFAWLFGVVRNWQRSRCVWLESASHGWCREPRGFSFLLHLIIQEENSVILVPRDLPTICRQTEDSLGSLERFWL